MLMRILHFSDVHTMINKPKYIPLDTIISKENPDIVLSSGDWDTYNLYTKIPTVYGNHDNISELYTRTSVIRDGIPVKVKRTKEGWELIEYNQPEFDNIESPVICGFGGAVIWDNYTYPEGWNTPDYYIKKYVELKERLQEKLIKCDILITHESPQTLVLFEHKQGVPNLNIDEKSYRIIFDTIVQLLRPKLYLCGHVHSTKFTQTQITYYDIFNTSPQNIPVIKTITTYGVYTLIDTDREVVFVKDMETMDNMFTVGLSEKYIMK